MRVTTQQYLHSLVHVLVLTFLFGLSLGSSDERTRHHWTQPLVADAVISISAPADAF
jgi:hypothetical protein